MVVAVALADSSFLSVVDPKVNAGLAFPSLFRDPNNGLEEEFVVPNENDGVSVFLFRYLQKSLFYFENFQKKRYSLVSVLWCSV